VGKATSRGSQNFSGNPYIGRIAFAQSSCLKLIDRIFVPEAERDRPNVVSNDVIMLGRKFLFS